MFSQDFLRRICFGSHSLLGSQTEIIKNFKYNVPSYSCKLNAVYKSLQSRMYQRRTGFTLLITFRPRTTSERRISGAVSPRVLTTDPGKGGKLEAARSNFGGGGTFASIKGTGRCNFYFSKSQTSDPANFLIKKYPHDLMIKV